MSVLFGGYSISLSSKKYKNVSVALGLYLPAPHAPWRGATCFTIRVCDALVFLAVCRLLVLLVTSRPLQGQAFTSISLHPTAAFSGQPQKVIMTSAPLKREGILASTVSPSNVVIASAAITRVRELA